MKEIAWPMGMDRDLASRPLVFDPKGFLVVILRDDEACISARNALIHAGIAADEMRVYTSTEILADHDRFLAERSTARRLVGALTDDRSTIELYFGHAREGHGALWLHAPDSHDASRAMRYLKDQQVLHYRHFGFDREEDIRVR